MNGTLRVTPAQLISTAGEFETCAGEVGTLTSQMTEMVTSLSSIWQGEAAEAYKNKFNGLNDDIQKMIAFIEEHSDDLKDMAQVYTTTEQTNEDLIANLSSDVIL